jgi:hypothetical protein
MASAQMPDKPILLNWFSYVAPSNPKVVLTHGEDGPRKALPNCLIDSILPKLGIILSCKEITGVLVATHYAN